ncbi:YtxH domain-containing protein [bacterium]|nr:YtxH domain-containing protein [bacterium]
MSIGKFIGGFAIGAVLGGIIGVLLAPQSGEETREILAKKSQDICDKTKETVSEIQSKADGIVNDMQAKGDELVSKLQEVINKQKHSEEA